MLAAVLLVQHLAQETNAAKNWERAESSCRFKAWEPFPISVGCIGAEEAPWERCGWLELWINLRRSCH
jgi:hypothetical protein